VLRRWGPTRLQTVTYVEAVPVVGTTGFGLQQTTLGQAVQPMNAVVAAVVGVGLPPIDLSLTDGGFMPNLMTGANVQADFPARFAQQYVVAGEPCVRFNSQIPGGGGWNVPITATKSSFEHSWSWSGRRPTSSNTAKASISSAY